MRNIELQELLAQHPNDKSVRVKFTKGGGPMAYESINGNIILVLPKWMQEK